MKKVLGIVGTAVTAAVVFAAPVAAQTQPISLNAGVQIAGAGSGQFERRVNANVNQEVLVQFSFANQSGERFSTIAGRVSLPSQLTFVNGSTRLFNRTNPNGMPMNDGITSNWANLGGYGPIDNDGRGTGSVSFRVRANGTGLVCGVNTLNIATSVAGYRDGKVATDAFVAYTAVDVVRQCGTDEGDRLPDTGMGAVMGVAAGAGALATAAGYMLVSRKK
ncbi:LPXTG cell wall anchor domain-containing protein [Candidatus Saccharibacteria bacterium]|nr:LPXTG cell wall anchor domain-containing protein [Candidatus Saccharibacteria bacterium]